MSFLSNALEVGAVGRRVLLARVGGAQTNGGVAILLDPAGRVLLTLARYRREWNFPGGYFEPGETPCDGIRRELTEEVAYPATAPTPVIVHTSPRPNHLEHFAVADLTHDEAVRLHCISWELRGAKWFGPHQMPPINKYTKYLLSNGEGVLSMNGSRWQWGERSRRVLDESALSTPIQAE
jgi:8-oxo-dGTP pyrophosphatase MutT (NUDIX family)